MFPQGYFRVHAHTGQVAAVILPRTQAVEFFVVKPAQPLPAFGVRPNPIHKSLLDEFLLALDDGRLLFIEHGLAFPIRVLKIIENTHILQVEGLFQDFVTVDALGAVGVAGFEIALVNTFPLDAPGPGDLRVVNLDVPLIVAGRGKQLKHELLDDFRGEPGRAQTHRDFTGGQVLRLHFFQSFHVYFILQRTLRRQLGRAQLFPHVAGEVFVSGLIHGPAFVLQPRHPEDHAGELCGEFILALPGKPGYIGHIHLRLLAEGERQGLAGRIHRCDNLPTPDGPFGKHIGLADKVPIIIHDL